MNRKEFISIATGTVVIAGITYYFQSDTRNYIRADTKIENINHISLTADEKQILYLASLAPSGHNTQPWKVKYLEPYHWVICNDKTKWLHAVDPAQRETILSIGAFLQNLEYAANSAGYGCRFKMLAKCNQDESIMDVRLSKVANPGNFDIEKIKHRRTLRSGYLNELLKNEDVSFLINEDPGYIHFIPNTSKEHTWLNEQTIEANKLQASRDDAQKELADWIRFSSKDAAANCDGLTTASMEIEGVAAWVLRNFYSKQDVMKQKFRQQSVSQVEKQVGQSAGWILISSIDSRTETLLETGKRMQRLFLKVREKNIAIHPMTQILEEPSIAGSLNSSIGISEAVQFILRTGYVKDYPEPVSLRRSIDKFVIT